MTDLSEKKISESVKKKVSTQTENVMTTNGYLVITLKRKSPIKKTPFSILTTMNLRWLKVSYSQPH